MPVSEPGWWYGPPDSAIARLLAPAASLWARAAARRSANARPYRSSLPVICVGNFTAGGTGKTPLAILLARMLTSRGERPALLTRGYGGRLAGPHLVQPAIDTATDVGDEPLLLARHAPVCVSRDRAAGARAIEHLSGIAPPTVIIMDDGLQNPSLAKDLTIALVDGRRGVGNGLVMPAGPLRAPLGLQLAMTDAIVVNRPRSMEPGSSEMTRHLRESFHGPVLEAVVAPSADTPELRGRRVIAVSGIANPVRFTSLLAELGAELVETRAFKDHHAFTEKDAASLLADARRLDARIVTTEKDHVRLEGTAGACAQLHAAMITVPVELQLDERDALRLSSLMDTALVPRRPPVTS